ncbi:hypothetical protein CCB80_09160 [Armatimonadetes bacterium Uphvl-Ar1]|nr:hypothetical protein CCB80_09160 [Armatimonadetes bacterium Uphvl-Ar1]
MGVTNYFSVDGEVIAESGASGYLSYHRDNLGSVCATLDSSGALVHQYQYKPFGELWSATGAGAQDRRLQWCGSWGYSAIALTRKFLSYYVRARHYAAILGNWTSVDPLWPSEMAYGYVENRVMTGVDYWGMKQSWVNEPSPLRKGFDPCGKDRNHYIYTYCNWCYAGGWLSDENCRNNCTMMARAYYIECKGQPGDGPWMPPPGGGQIAPNHPPPEKTESWCAPKCTAEKYPGAIEACVGGGWPTYMPTSEPIGRRVEPGRATHIFNRAKCDQCCDAATSTVYGHLGGRYDSKCQKLRDRCKQRCQEEAVWGTLKHMQNAVQRRDPLVPKKGIEFPVEKPYEK